MADQQLKDRSNNILGTIKESSDKLVLVDRSNNIKGVYKKKENKTYDSQNRLVGTGNLLTTLL